MSDDSGRLLELLVVPYNQVARVGQDLWERIAPGALRPVERVPLMDEHRNTVGIARSFTERPDGLYGTFYMSRTPRGDELLTLARDGALGVSPGFIPDPGQSVAITDQLVEQRSGELREVTLTGRPAYLQAGVLAVRTYTDGGEAMPEPTTEPEVTAGTTEETPAPSAPAPAAAAPAVEERSQPDLEARLDRLEDSLRSRAIEEEQQRTPTILTRARPGQPYRTPGELMQDVIRSRGAASQAGIDETMSIDARQRLTRLMEDRSIWTDPRGTQHIELRAFAAVGVLSETATPDGYVPELLRLIRQGRVIANFLQSRDLDPVPGAQVELPHVTQGATMGYVGDPATVPGQEVTQALAQYPKAVIAGGQGVTIQARDWSNPSYMDTVMQDQLSAYGDFLNQEVAVGDGAVGPPAHHTGVRQGATVVAAVGAPGSAALIKDVVQKVAEAKAGVFAVVRRWPAICFAAADTWAGIEGWTDADGRPLLVVGSDGPTNALGTTAGPSPVGRFRGMTAYAEDSFAVEDIVIPDLQDAFLYESALNPATVSLMYPDALTIDVTTFGYSAVAVRRPTAVEVVSNALGT